MLAPVLAALALNLAVSAPPAVSRGRLPDPPIKVWLSSDGDFLFGQNAKVYAKAARDGYLVVLHADTRGRIRVLFPIDPADQQSVKGGKKYELKARGNREAFVADDSGSGAVFAAYAESPFEFSRFAKNGHWDYRALAADSADGDPEARLADIVQEMKPADRYTYDVATYVVSDASYAYRGRGGYPGWGGRPGWYGPRVGFSIRLGAPYYGGGRYFDPFYDPFFSGSSYRWGGIRSWGRQ